MPRKIQTRDINDIKDWTIEYGCVPTKFGDIQLGAIHGTVCFLYFASLSQLKANIEKLKKRFPNAEFKENIPRSKALADKIFLDKNDNIEIFLSGTEFQNSVWRSLLKIPSGETWTYSDCAGAMGKPTAVRAVANAVANNEIAFLIPCHRVVSKDGNKFKYRWGAEIKKDLLHHEGITEF